jgi:hypothetical protein
VARHLTRSFLPLVGGVTGVVVAHIAAYLLAFSSPNQRADALRATGHGYWDHAVVLAVVAAVVAVAQAAVRGLRRWPVEREPEGARFCRRLLLLAGWQLALFTGMEVIERIAAGVAPGTLLETPTFAFGLLLQFVVAAVILLMLGGFEHLVATVARRLRHRRGSVRRPRPGQLPDVILGSRRFSAAAPRAPPTPVWG